MRTRKFTSIIWIVCSTILFFFILPTNPVNAQVNHAEGRDTSDVTITIDRIASSSGLPNVLLISKRSGTTWLPPEYSLDGGATWTEVTTTPWPNDTQLTIALAPRLDQSVRIIVGAGDLLYRTGDFGATWAEDTLNQSDFGPRITFLTASPVDPTLLYASGYTVYGGFPFGPSTDIHGYASADAGVTWQWIAVKWDDGTYDGFQLMPSPLIAQRVFSTVYGSVMSDDAGTTWITMTVPFVGNVWPDAQNDSLLYSQRKFGSEGIRSIDGGANWIPWGQSPQECSNLLAHPTQSQLLFLNCTDGIYRSLNGGDVWQKILCTPAERQPILAADHGVSGRLLLSYEGGLWETVDDGTTWTPIISTADVGLYCSFLPTITTLP